MMKRILLAYDGGEPAKRALATTAELAKKFEALVGVISVVPVYSARIGMDLWDDPEVHRNQLEEARSLLALQGIEAELIEPIGAPAETIERIARDGAFDTVVMGSRGLGAVSRLLQGSVSGHVATHADATVVVVR
jgi:nucleotide-binding universal stress UspA family protein